MELTAMTKEMVLKFQERVGVGGLRTIRILKNLYPWINIVVEKEPGATILKEDIERHEELLMKGYSSELTEREKAEFEYLKNRLTKIASKVKTYIEAQNKIINSVKEG